MAGEIKLVLEPVKSALHNLVCYEVINETTLDKLISSDLLQDSNDWIETKQFKKIRFATNYGYTKVIYKKAEMSKNHPMDFGRVYPINNVGLCMTRRQLRHTLAKEYYFDIDLVNAQPTILYQVCKSNTIECKLLKEYIKNREQILTNMIKQYNINRDEAKNCFVCLMMGGGIKKWFSDNKINDSSDISKYLIELHQELTTIKNIIAIKNMKVLGYQVEKNKIEKEKEDYVLENSILAFFLQEYECRILEAMYLYCKKNKIIENNCVSLIFDGLLIRKYKVQDINKLMEELEICIKNITGFDMKLSCKEMNEDYIDILDQHQIEHEKRPNCYDSIKEEFEKNHFKLMNPISYATIDKDESLILRKKTDFFNAYENILYEKSKLTERGEEFKETSFLNDWFRDNKNRTYKKIVFLPRLKTDDDVYNSFKCFEVENKISTNKNLSNSSIYNHLYNLCGRDDKIFKYVLMVLSRKVKEPTKLSNVALIFRSVEGVGKDLFFNWFGNKILGSRFYINTSDVNAIYGKFNTSIEDKIVIVLNEAKGKNNYEIDNRIKDNITNKINRIEHKGLNAYEQNNCIQFIYLTNSDNPVKIDPTDRRFVAIDCYNELANNKEYIDDIISEMESGDYDKVFFEFLMNMKSDNYDFTNNRPITDFFNDLREINIPCVARYLENLLFLRCENQTENTFKSIELLLGFNLFCQDNNFKNEMNMTRFGLEIKKYKSIIKKRGKKGNIYTFNYEELKQELISKKYIQDF